jgi:hypothetical protein
LADVSQLVGDVGFQTGADGASKKNKLSPLIYCECLNKFNRNDLKIL